MYHLVDDDGVVLEHDCATDERERREQLTQTAESRHPVEQQVLTHLSHNIGQAINYCEFLAKMFIPSKPQGAVPHPQTKQYSLT